MISIDVEKCESCSSCWKVCPNFVIRPVAQDGRTVASVAHEDLCNLCGHCVAFCKPGAVRHESFPPGDITELDFSDVKTESLSNLLVSRRSVRTYLDRSVPRELVDRMLEVASHAGTGSNSQSVRFMVLRDRDKLRELEKFTLDTGWNAGLKYLDRKGPMAALRLLLGADRAAQFKRYHDVFHNRMQSGEIEGTIFRGAPMVLLAHDHKLSASACENCAIAIRNVETLAMTMGLGTCWVGLFTFVALKRHGKVNAMLGLSDTRRVHGALLVGYPKHERMLRIPRKLHEVKFI